jgi:hypothetical protein
LETQVQRYLGPALVICGSFPLFWSLTLISATPLLLLALAAACAAYRGGSIWWLLRATRPDTPVRPHAVLIWIPSVPPALMVGWALVEMTRDDLALGAVYATSIALIVIGLICLGGCLTLTDREKARRAQGESAG